MTKNQTVKEFKRLRETYNNAKQAMEDFYPMVDELLVDCPQEGNHWEGIFGQLKLIFQPKTRENISVVQLQKTAPEIYEQLKEMGLITKSEYFERRVKEA